MPAESKIFAELRVLGHSNVMFYTLQLDLSDGCCPFYKSDEKSRLNI